MVQSERGSRFLAAPAAKDTEVLLAIFAPDVQFRGVTPGRLWEATSSRDVIEIVLYKWFLPDDVVEVIEHVEEGRIVDRQRIDYRLRVRNPRGLFVVEQRAYFDLDASNRVARMHAICAGFRPIDTHRLSGPTTSGGTSPSGPLSSA